MKKNEQLSLEMFERVAVFGDGLNGSQPPLELNERALELFAENKLNIAQIRTTIRDQVAGNTTSNSGTDQRAQIAVQLNKTLRAMSQIARSVNPDLYPGMASKFPTPRKGGRNYPVLLALATAFAKDAPSYESVFIKRGMPGDFVARLNNLVASFRVASDLQTNGTQNRVGGTVGIAALVRKGMATIRELRAALRVPLETNPQLAGMFKHASRVEQASQPSAVSTTQPPAASTTAQQALPGSSAALSVSGSGAALGALQG